MKIRDLDIGTAVALAPMAGYTDRAMRLVCHRMGADYTVTEMVSAKAVVFGDKKTVTLARIMPDEGKVGIQIFGSEPDVMAEAAARLSNPDRGARPVVIDINMGCPVKKIFSNGDGSALMKNPPLIEKIVDKIVRSTDLPVTVKLRAGVDSDSLNATECALRAQAGGASAICIHGRTTAQMYGGKADRKIIEKVKNCLQIPLFANGDITNADEALSMLSDTGADGIMIGRGAVGNPFIFRDIKAALSGKPAVTPTIEERIQMSLNQLSIAIEDKGERLAVPESRKQIALYLKYFRGAAAVRAAVNSATTFDQIKSALLSLSECEAAE